MWRDPESYLVHLALRIAKGASERPVFDPVALRLALRMMARCGIANHLLTDFWHAVHATDWKRHHRGPLYVKIAMFARSVGYDVADELAPCDGWVMCNRYRMSASRAALIERYGLTAPSVDPGDLPPPELFPKRLATVILGDRLYGGRRMTEKAWGFPRKMRGASGKVITTHVTNVRNLDSQFWRSTIADAKQRCLVPVTSFSEYGPGPKGAKPLWWFDIPSRPIFSFAGIWRMTGDGPVFAFLTTEPNSVVAPIHPKAMPVILHDEDEERWLAGPVNDALSLVASYPSQLMSAKQADPRRERQDDDQPEHGELDLGDDTAELH